MSMETHDQLSIKCIMPPCWLAHLIWLVSMSKKTSGIAWLTHFEDPEGQAAFQRLAKEAAQWARVIQFRDGMGIRDDAELFEDRAEISSDDVVVLSRQAMATASPWRYSQWQELKRAGRYEGGYMDVVLITIADYLSAYDYVWIIESDVDFTGYWGQFFEQFAACEADLLGTTLYPRLLSQSWYHWPNFTGPSSLDPATPFRGFFPVVRLSRQFVRTYQSEVPNEWAGHYEALWPTIALHRGLKVEDIGGYGPLVPAGRRGCWYTNNHDPALSFGSFRYRPAIASRYYPMSDAQLPKNQLCHPVKTKAWTIQAESRAKHNQI